MKKLYRAFAFAFALFGANQAYAGIPVIDVANLANSLQQVVAWGEQYQQMVQQITSMENQLRQAQQTFGTMNGIRNMANLVNNPLSRNYLPPQWDQSMNIINTPGGFGSLSGSITAIRNASKLVDVTAATTLPPTSVLGQSYTAAQDQAAINRGMSEASYAAASDRMANIQTLLNKVNDAPEQKDVLDLQARIQAEQAMLQTETNKLASLQLLQQAQRDIQAQRAREISIAASYGPMAPGY